MYRVCKICLHVSCALEINKILIEITVPLTVFKMASHIRMLELTIFSDFIYLLCI